MTATKHRQTRPEVNTADTDGCDPQTKGEPKYTCPLDCEGADGWCAYPHCNVFHPSYDPPSLTPTPEAP